MKLVPEKLLFAPVSGLFIPNVDDPADPADPNVGVEPRPPNEVVPLTDPGSLPAADDPKIPGEGPNNPAPWLALEGVTPVDDPKEELDCCSPIVDDCPNCGILVV